MEERIEINYDLADMCFQQMKRAAFSLEENTQDVETFVTEIGRSGWQGQDYESFSDSIMTYNKKLRDLSNAMIDFTKTLENFTDDMYENEMFLAKKAATLKTE